MSSRRFRAFTLVELLVVIGIITLLISILLPALNSARQQGYRVTCQANLRSIEQAEKLYENEWKGSIMWANFRGWSRSGQAGWLYQDPLPPGASPSPAIVKNGLVYLYLKDDRVLRCPVDQPPYLQGPTQNLTSFLMNTCMFDGAHAAASPAKFNPAKFTLKISKFATDSIIFWEASNLPIPTEASWKDGTVLPDGMTLSNRHQNGANVAYIDGHIEWWAKPDFEHYRTRDLPYLRGLPNAIYCAPDVPTGGP